MIANEGLFVASQEAANVLVNSRNSIFIEALSATIGLHGGEIVILKLGDIGRLFGCQH